MEPQSSQFDIARLLERQPSERHFRESVVDVAHYYGWHVVHVGPGQTLVDSIDDLGQVDYDSSGFPDLILIHQTHPHLLWFRELKTDRSRDHLWADQQRWKERLTMRGYNWDVWFPAKWNEIIQSLRGGGRPIEAVI